MRFLVLSICLTLTALSTALSPLAAEGQEVEPAQLLQERFQLQFTGQVWEQKEEPCLQLYLKDLPALRQQIRTERRALKTLAENNLNAWLAVQGQIQRLRAQRAALTTGDSEKKKIDKQLKDLKDKAIDPKDLCGCGSVMARLQRLVDLELEAARKALWARRVLESLPKRRAELARRADVALALASLGQQLSSPERYRDAPEVLSQVESLVLSKATPLYRQNGQLRFGVLLNEESPATFSWDNDSKHLFIPHSLSEAAGLQPVKDVPPSRLEVVKGRTLRVRQVVIPQLRVGGYVMRDVKAWELPPSGSDLGARLGRKAAQQLRPEPQRLRLQVSSP